MPQPLLDQAEADGAACRAMLREGSHSFDAACRFMPRSVREPAIALYAFCRSADDAIDGASAPDRLDSLRDRLSRVYAGKPLPMPPDRAFARVVAQFAIPRAVPEALLEGFAWDAEGGRYADLVALRRYAIRVAGTVGVMMALLMGVRDTARLDRAIELGVAMQFSNIARDVGEDARAGRLYLPLDWLAAAGIDPQALLAAPRFTPALGGVIRMLLQAAEAHYRRAATGIAHLPLSCRFAITAACSLYAEIGREVGRRDMDPITSRAVVSRRRKAIVLTRDMAWMPLRVTPLDETRMADAAWLRDAVVRQKPAMPRRNAVAWWQISTRLQSFIDLLEVMAQREQAHT